MGKFNEKKEILRKRLYQIIFKSDTREGRMFDFRLSIAIIISVLAVLLDSIPDAHAGYGSFFAVVEWGFTILFSIEYLVRVWVMGPQKWKYILSVLGIIDLISVLPTYLGIFLVGFQSLIVFRSLRLLRVFRIFKLWHYLRDSKQIVDALYNSYRKIMLFMIFVVIAVLIIGSVMYIVEKGTPGFDSIPNSIYWAVVTITTVGYGDISPVTPVGRFLSVVVMICGYSIIAVPTGILTSEMMHRPEGDLQKSHPKTKMMKERVCDRCGATGHSLDARYCRICGEYLLKQNPSSGNKNA